MSKEICCVNGCNKLRYAKGFCNTHYHQMLRFGEIRPITKKDNEIILYENYAEIILCNKFNEEVARAKIDLDDIDKIKDYRWYLSKSRYVLSHIGNKEYLILHRFVMDVTDKNKDIVVDHIDRNTLNNTKSNLRKCTPHQNSMNRSLLDNNTSSKTGVIYDKNRSKWRAEIRYNGKKIYLGRFDNFEDAVRAREEAEKKYFGEFASK